MRRYLLELFLTVGAMTVMIAALLLLAMACSACNGTVYIDGSRKVQAIPAGTTLVLPDGTKQELRDSENGGSEKWWLLTDKYLLEIFEELKREVP